MLSCIQSALCLNHHLLHLDYRTGKHSCDGIWQHLQLYLQAFKVKFSMEVLCNCLGNFEHSLPATKMRQRVYNITL